MARQHYPQSTERDRSHAGSRRGVATRYHPFALILGLLLIPGAMPGAEFPVYSHRVWQSADGLPEDLAQSIARTPDGYLWIGTSGGLVRFDGVKFTSFTSETEPSFRDDSFYSLLVSRDGALWGGTEGGGLVRYKDGRFSTFGSAAGLTNGFVRAILEDASRTLWVGTDNGLFRMREGSLTRVDARDGLPRMSVNSICEDRHGRLLVGGGTGLLILGREGAIHYSSRESRADNNIRAIRETKDGAIWIGTISGLRRLENGVRGDPFTAKKIITGNNISFLLEGRGGEIWIGTYGQGLMRHNAGTLTRFTAPALLPHNNVMWLFDDGEDNTWVGTQGGLLRLSSGAASTLTTADRAPQSINSISLDPKGGLLVTALNGQLYQVADHTLVPARVTSRGAEFPVRNTFRDSTGTLWIGTDGQGVIRLSDAGPVRLTMKDGLVNDFVRAFCEDRDHAIWIGTDGGLSRWQSGRFQNFNTDTGLVYASVRALLMDRTGDLWVGTDGGLSHLRSGAFLSDAPLQGLRGLKIWSMTEDSEGGLWIGTHGAGLFVLKAGKLSRFTVAEGLPSNKIHFIAEDSRGYLRMSGPEGVVSIARRDLEHVFDSKASQLAVRWYGMSEGLGTNQMNGGVQPAGVMTPSGEFWLPSTKGAVRIIPDVPNQAGAPRVVIEQILADDRVVPFSNNLQIGPGEGKLEIRYAAIRLRSAERMRFRYWMEGLDRGWTEVGQRRIAYYTNMPAGTYRFHVAGYDINDPGKVTEQTISIRWRPHFYETGWFSLCCALLVGAALWVAYRIHVRNIQTRFAAVLEERNRLAREMHDTLIQGCVGVSALLEAASHAYDISPVMSLGLLERARTEVRRAVDEARLAVWNLRHNSGDGEDVVRAVSDLVNRVSVETGIPAEVKRTGDTFALSADGQSNLLMLVREALQNSVRHASPQRLSVHLDFNRCGLNVDIEDDGRGFDPSSQALDNRRHYGLIGMRERVEKLGGEFAIRSSPGQGTHVRVRIPPRQVAIRSTLISE